MIGGSRNGYLLIHRIDFTCYLASALHRVMRFELLFFSAVPVSYTHLEYARWEEHDMPLQIQLHPDINYKKDAFDAILRLKLKILMGHIENNIAVINQLQAEGNAVSYTHLDVYKRQMLLA